MTIPEFEKAAADSNITDSQLIEYFRQLPISAAERWLPLEQRQAPLVLEILARLRPQMYIAFMRIGMEGCQ
jgi:hypothetical protein